MTELKNQVEAILFAAGKKVTYEDLARICNVDISAVKQALNDLKKEYDQKGSLLLTEEIDGWKLTVREKYLATVHKLMPETELSKTILETLAVIAWKQPVLQSEVIKIRTNKAYDHIKELEDFGFVTKEKKGRSFVLKVSHKFNEYFDLPDNDAVRKLFKDVKEAEEAQKKLDQLEVYNDGGKEKEDETSPKRKLNTLEVYNLPKEEIEKEGSSEIQEQEPEKAESKEEQESPWEEEPSEKQASEETESKEEQESSETEESEPEEESEEVPEKSEDENKEEQEEKEERKLSPALERLISKGNDKKKK